MKTPRFVNLEITGKCNLRCSYCYHFTSAGDVPQDLPAHEWLKFLEELNRCRIMNVTLSGGEPLCRDDLREIIRGIVDNRMRFKLFSNGTLVTEDMAAFLGSTGRCDRVQISIDGSSSATHDLFRGKGTFLKAIEGLKLLQECDILVNAYVIVHKGNFRDLEEIARFLLEELGVSWFAVDYPVYLGLCRQNRNQVQLEIEERSDAMATLWKLSKKYKGRIGASSGPLAEAIQWLDMENARKGLVQLSGRGRLVGCLAPLREITVRPDGVIVPCRQLSHIELGQINQDDLEYIWQNHPKLARLRKRSEISLDSFEFCQGCEYIDYCTGGCPAVAYNVLSDDSHPNPHTCLRQFLEAGGRIPDEEPYLAPNIPGTAHRWIKGTIR